jgi:NAD(P)-dependent dehydrogenase (short-subunit alcohol dehydrogenase family)
LPKSRRANDQGVRKIDLVVNNAAEQHPRESIEKITEQQLERTFRTNIFSFFFMTKAAMKHLKKGAAIINTTSVTAYKGSPHLLDYSSTKGAITAFTRSLSQALADKAIRVNGVAPVRSGRPSFHRRFQRKRPKRSAPMFHCVGPANPKKLRPASCFLLLTILHT